MNGSQDHVAEILANLLSGMGRIEGELAGIKERLDSGRERFRDVSGAMNDHEKRLQRVERRVAVFTAVSAIVGALGGALSYLATTWLAFRLSI